MAEPKSPASVENSTTNQAGSAPSLPKFWKGHVTGSNRGTIIIRLEREGGTYRGDAIFHDDLFGVTTFRIEGSLQGNNAKLQMRHFRVNSLSASFTGKADVTFDHGLTRSYGTWDTDIASGTLNVYADRCDSLWSTPDSLFLPLAAHHLLGCATRDLDGRSVQVVAKVQPLGAGLGHRTPSGTAFIVAAYL